MAAVTHGAQRRIDKEPLHEVKAAAQPASTRPRSAEMTPGPGFRIRLTIERPRADIVAALGEFETPDISDMLNRMYTMSPEIRNLANRKPLAGPALTVKVFPGDNLMVHKALDAARPGDVIVVDTGGSRSNAVLGDLVATKAKPWFFPGDATQFCTVCVTSTSTNCFPTTVSAGNIATGAAETPGAIVVAFPPTSGRRIRRCGLRYLRAL